MKTRFLVTLASFVTMLTLAAAPAVAQSLADVARKEESRRSAVAMPSKTYTNADLKPDLTRPTPPAPSATQTVAQPPAATATSGSTSSNATPGTATLGAGPDKVVQRDDTFNEAHWRPMAESIRGRLAAAQKNEAELKSAPDNNNEKEKARIAAALARASAAVVAIESELKGFETRATQMKVPRSWIQ